MLKHHFQRLFPVVYQQVLVPLLLTLRATVAPPVRVKQLVKRELQQGWDSKATGWEISPLISSHHWVKTEGFSVGFFGAGDLQICPTTGSSWSVAKGASLRSSHLPQAWPSPRGWETISSSGCWLVETSQF